MENEPLVVERTFNSPIEKVWNALTDKHEMDGWYFTLPDFKAEKGFKFSFTGGDEQTQYIHHCEILEAVAPSKLCHTWTYEKNGGYSTVTWELFEEAENITRVRLTHDGLGSFSNGDPNFEVSSFTKGWKSILGEALRKHLENN